MNDSDETRVLADIQEENRDLGQQILGLQQTPSRRLQRRVRAIPRAKARRRVLRLAWATALVFGIVGLFFASPDVSATLGGMWAWVGQIQLAVQDTYQSEGATNNSSSPVIEVVAMSLDEAYTAVPYSFIVPTYLPPTLLIQEEVSVIKLDLPIVNIRWRDQQGGFVQLTAHPFSNVNIATKTLVGLDSYETLVINNTPAALIHGGWDAESQTWDHEAGITTIIWARDGTQYRLLDVSETVQVEELLRMAESIQ